MKAVFISLSLALFLTSCQSKAKEEPAKPNQEAAIPVKLLALESQKGEQVVEATGLIGTENEARLSFKIGGIIESVAVKEGQNVKKGQLLASLKSTEIEAQVQQVQLALEKAVRDYQRASNLYKDSVATLEQLQNAKTGVDIAKQNLQQVMFNRQYANIYAPTDGFIVKKIGNPGELASPGSPVIFMNSISGSSKWILKTGVADQQWAAVSNGDKATVTIDAFPGKTFTAIVSKKALAADAASGSFLLELQLNMQSEKPAIGMFGKALIKTSHTSAGFSLPYEALLEANGYVGYVFATNDQKKVTKVTVTISRITNDRVYLSGGLEGYRYVVVTGSPYLTEDATIKVIN